MKKWGTEIYAKCNVDLTMKTFIGQTIEAPTRRLAHEYCINNGLGYLHITDELIAEIRCKDGTFEADFNKMIDYEKTQNN